MRVTIDPRGLSPAPGGSVVSVGVFDGVHLGHQAILAANLRRAGELGAEATVVTFVGHPKAVLLGRAPRTLTTLEHRLALFARAGVAHVVTLTFDEELRDTSARAITDELFVASLGARAFVLGFDSKFGRGRAGGPESLVEWGYDVEIVPKVTVGQRAVSSTAIREAVELGDLAGAARMLGRPVGVYGEVVRGDALGRRLGFPTANLDLHHELHPPPGVYACRAHVVRAPSADAVPDERDPIATHGAVANIGFRPTVAGDPGEEPSVEVHLLDFEGDLYGRRLEVEFVERLRGERRFADLEELAARIGRDVERARAVLGRSGHSPGAGPPH